MSYQGPPEFGAFSFTPPTPSAARSWPVNPFDHGYQVNKRPLQTTTTTVCAPQTRRLPLRQVFAFGSGGPIPTGPRSMTMHATTSKTTGKPPQRPPRGPLSNTGGPARARCRGGRGATRRGKPRTPVQPPLAGPRPYLDLDAVVAASHLRERCRGNKNWTLCAACLAADRELRITRKLNTWVDEELAAMAAEERAFPSAMQRLSLVDSEMNFAGGKFAGGNHGDGNIVARNVADSDLTEEDLIDFMDLD